MTDLEIYARLAADPWCMTREQIGRLSRWWIINVLFYPRDRDGNMLPITGYDGEIVPQDDDPVLTAADLKKIVKGVGRGRPQGNGKG